MVNKKDGQRVSQEFYIYFRYVYQDKSVSIRELVRRYNQFFFPTIWRHATKEVEARRIDKYSRGARKPKLNARDQIATIRALRQTREHDGNVTSKRVQIYTCL